MRSCSRCQSLISSNCRTTVSRRSTTLPRHSPLSREASRSGRKQQTRWRGCSSCNTLQFNVRPVVKGLIRQDHGIPIPVDSEAQVPTLVCHGVEPLEIIEREPPKDSKEPCELCRLNRSEPDLAHVDALPVDVRVDVHRPTRSIWTDAVRIFFVAALLGQRADRWRIVKFLLAFACPRALLNPEIMSLQQPVKELLQVGVKRGPLRDAVCSVGVGHRLPP